MAVSKKEKNAKEKAKRISLKLAELYPDAECALVYGDDPWRLLVMARLSAQCTDKRVNEVSVPLFNKYPDAVTMAQANLTELEEIVKPCGLFRTKAKSIVEMSQSIISEFRGRVPDTMEELLTLSGVGRKIANLILGDIYKKPGIVADTHCIRLAGRFGFVNEGEKNPYKVEVALSKLIDGEEQSDFCHRIVLFGRDVCSARSPKCHICPLREECTSKEKK